MSIDQPLRVFVAVSIALMLSSSVTANDRPVVEIAQGSIRGVDLDGVAAFKGIPYVAQPVGELRWRSPHPPASWEGVRDADDFGPACPQILRPNYSIEVLGDRPMAEDCLYLNVWTPGVETKAPRPVMVWLLPGSFMMGDASMPRYDGRALAGQGVVVVTFNFRIGMLGQFAHPALRRTRPDEPMGNYHLMDQIAALEWVRDNIAAFGGDPGNVTIFGMSAGGVSVNVHMAVPESAGLFHRAISESSAIRISKPRHISTDRPGLPSLETEGRRIADTFGFSGNDDNDVAARLRALTVDEILNYQANHRLGVGGSLNPVVDGKVVVRGVAEVFASGDQHPVPYLTGATNWEGSLLGWAKTADPVLGLLDVSRQEAVDLYGETDEAGLMNGLYIDLFLGTQRHLARHHSAAGHPSFVYYFSRVLDEHRGDLPGAAHGAEMRYVFQTLDSLTLLGEQLGVFGHRPNETDKRYSEMVSAYWVQFAKTGNPNGDGRPGWPATNPGNDLVLEFGQEDATVHRDFMEWRQEFWEEHFASGGL